VPSATEPPYGREGSTEEAASPKEVVDRLHDGMVAALGASEVQATLRDQGAVPADTTAEQFRQFVHDEVAKSDRIVSQAGIQLE
jgi:tripartite-type tricarboxylate transporter receptor subunit TctC